MGFESTINTNTRVYFISVIQITRKERAKLKLKLIKDQRRLKISFENDSKTGKTPKRILVSQRR